MRNGEDEIAILAEQCMALGDGACREAIDRNITRATSAARWDEMCRWHRVKLRVKRLRQQRDTGLVLRAGGMRGGTGGPRLAVG